MTLIITKNGRNAQKIGESRFVDEDNLQNFIHENPDCVPLYDIEDDIRLLILAREVPTRSGPIDAIGTDANGEVYIIETKLYKNPDKRLVVAQVLDYGASISENADNLSGFYQAIEEKVSAHFKMSMADRLTEFYDLMPEDSGGIVESFKENLAEGRFRFVVLMNHIEKRLKDLITFINRNSRFDIYGVELEHYKYNDFEITIPKLFGSEVKKEVSNGSAPNRRRTWNENSFFEDIRTKMNEDEATLIKHFYSYFVQTADMIKWGTGSLKGSFNPIFRKLGPRSIITVFSDGTLQLNYAWFTENEQQNKFRVKFIEALGPILDIPPDDGHPRYPNYPLAKWSSRTVELKTRISAVVGEC